MHWLLKDMPPLTRAHSSLESICDARKIMFFWAIQIKKITVLIFRYVQNDLICTVHEQKGQYTSLLCLRLQKAKGRQHRTFPGSRPAQYWCGPRLLNFQVRSGAGCCQPGMAASEDMLATNIYYYLYMIFTYPYFITLWYIFLSYMI